MKIGRNRVVYFPAPGSSVEKPQNDPVLLLLHRAMAMHKEGYNDPFIRPVTEGAALLAKQEKDIERLEKRLAVAKYVISRCLAYGMTGSEVYNSTEASRVGIEMKAFLEEK